MRFVTSLLRFVAIDGVLVTATLILAITFAVHLVFVLMPAPVAEQYVVEVAGLEDTTAVGSVEERLRAAFERDAFALWIGHDRDGRADVTARLLGQAMREDAERLTDRRTEGVVDTPDVIASYGDWLGSVLRFDLGTSRSGLSLVDELKEKAPLTFKLSLAAYLAAIFAAALIALTRAFRPRDRIVQIGHYSTYLITALPAFVLGYVFIAVFHLDVSERPGLLLAIITLTFSSGILNEVERIIHHQLSEELRANYIKTARSKGLSSRAVLPVPGAVAFHAFRQAAVQFLPRLAQRVPMVVGMAILVEKVFVLPGLGDTLIDGLAYRDEPRVLAVVLIAILIVRLCELLTRGGKLLLDPRALSAGG